MFQIRPVLGGTTRWVNRRRLVLDPRQVDESFRDAFPVPFNDSSIEGDVSNCGSSSYDCDSEDDIPDWFYLGKEPKEVVVEPEIVQSVRRSTRSTRGLNRNPHRLPSSAVTGLPM